MSVCFPRKRGGAQPGHIAPVSSGELKTHGLAYKIVFMIFPIAWAISILDRLLPARTNNAVIVTAVKQGRCMRVLITGAGGFIGSHLVDSQLEKGLDVRAVDLHLDLLKHRRRRILVSKRFMAISPMKSWSRSGRRCGCGLSSGQRAPGCIALR